MASKIVILRVFHHLSGGVKIEELSLCFDLTVGLVSITKGQGAAHPAPGFYLLISLFRGIASSFGDLSRQKNGPLVFQNNYTTTGGMPSNSKVLYILV